MLDPSHARLRQKRLLQVIEREKLDAVVVGQPRHVYYFSCHRPFWLHESAFVLFADGRSTLVAAKGSTGDLAADAVETYEATWKGTQREVQAANVAAAVDGVLNGRAAGHSLRVGVDVSTVSLALALHCGRTSLVSIEPALQQLRRRKEPDELALMRRAAECAKAMYERARRIIVPGITELAVYNELATVAVEVAGEPLWPEHLGNDFQSGSSGGAPRKDRKAAAGELYILDLGPAYRGYFSDSSRAFAVGHEPSDPQLEAWRTVTGVFPLIEQLARPGLRCRDLYATIDDYYKAATGAPFPHHLGHGVGLQPHEFPHLNPQWDDTLQEGEIFTAEPGLYSDALKAGMRLENLYLVTATGVENLTPFPLELA